jgi:hypothetical protein
MPQVLDYLNRNSWLPMKLPSNYTQRNDKFTVRQKEVKHPKVTKINSTELNSEMGKLKSKCCIFMKLSGFS